MGNAGSYCDRREIVDGTEVVYNARDHTLLYPPPQAGSESQDEDYAKWFLHALVHRYEYVAGVLKEHIKSENCLMNTLRHPVHYMSDAERDAAVSRAYSRRWQYLNFFNGTNGSLVRERIQNLQYWLSRPPNRPYVHVEKLLDWMSRYDDHTQRYWLDVILEHLDLAENGIDPELGNFRDVLDDIRGRWDEPYERHGEEFPMKRRRLDEHGLNPLLYQARQQ